ncbi:hypothetical protein CDL60_17515 [Roseateles noduli]|nr:hypothetical protein CDL60_17515 [Roseateles noduli]
MSFKNSRVWRATLAERPNDPNSDSRSRLKNAFLQTRDSVIPLVAQISKELPSLTVHDISHLDALWGMADILVGEDVWLNPAEAFVLGVSFLLHDSATSSAAFSGNIVEIKSTVEWKDYVAQLQINDDALGQGTADYQRVVFEVLRLLHPKQAENLPRICWKLEGGVDKYLIDDVQLRNHYGRVIGRIAHSHWWDLAEVEREWASAAPLSPHASLSVIDETPWVVDAFRVAVLLRCCDAMHIDSRRAPDMLAAIVKPGGHSKLHWHFQNKLGLPNINLRSELYWSSGQAFGPDDAKSWWLCFETARMVHREIVASNRLLEHHGRTQFVPRGVMGADNVDEFSQNVVVEGWNPVDVNFKVTQIPKIIENFGGARLYGGEPWRALRELLQNANDAIRARALKRNISGGEIFVGLVEDETGEAWLEVRDNGIGMSQYVLSEVLLDFGRSLWSDPAVRQHLPGLMAKGFRAVGQFGIGFLAVFMLGDEVTVTSWADGDSEQNQCTLVIEEGAKSRPVLRKPSAKEKLEEYGTRVLVRLREGVNALLPQTDTYFNKVKWTLEELVGSLLPTAGMDVRVSHKNGLSTVVRKDDWLTLDSQHLLKRIAPHCAKSELLTVLHPVVEDDGEVVGRLGLQPEKFFRVKLGDHPGALVHNGVLVGIFNGLTGILQAGNNGDLARTTASPICSRKALAKWAAGAVKSAKSDSWFDNRNAAQLLSAGLEPSMLAWGDGHPGAVTKENLKEWLVSFDSDEILILNGNVSTPSDYSENDFEENFSLYSNVIQVGEFFHKRDDFGLGPWVGLLVPETDGPRSLIGVLSSLLGAAYEGVTIENTSLPVGEIHGKAIESDCWRIGLAD